MFHRLKNDFRLSIITMLSLCALVGITPFAFLRFMQGNLVVGIVDLGILVVFADEAEQSVIIT